MKQGAAAGLAGGDGAPAAMGGGGWAWELRWGEVKPFPRSDGAEGGRRRGLHGEVGAAAALLTGGGIPAWLGDGDRAEELREDVRKVVVRSILA